MLREPHTTLSAGLDQGGVRRMNTAVVLRALAAIPEDATLQELSSATGLSRRTLEVILDALCRTGWAVASDAYSGGAGRPAKRFRYVADHRVAAALRIDTHAAHAMIVDLRGRVLGRAVEPLGASYFEPHEAIERLAATFDRAREAAGVPHTAIAAGAIAAGGVIDTPRGCVTRLVNAPEWTGFPLAAALEARLGVPFTADNDANLAAFAEHRAGVATSHDDIAWLIYGNRTGVGFLINGEVHHGHGGGAGEIIESRVLGLERDASNRVGMLTSPVAEERSGALALVEAARAGDPDALAEARRFAASLADVVDVLAWTVAPGLVVLGGGLETASDVLIPLVVDCLAALGDPAIELAATSLGADAVLIGAARTAVETISASVFASIVAA